MEEQREVAVTTDIRKINWFNGLYSFLDLGGCDNVVNAQSAKTQLQLSI